MSYTQLNNLLGELIKLSEEGKNPIPIELLDKQIECIKETKKNCGAINTAMSMWFQHGKIKNDISAPVMSDQTDFYNVLRMRLDCYEILKELYVHER